jgi:hypothetical protein
MYHENTYHETAVGLSLFRLTDNFSGRKFAEPRVFCVLMFFVSSIAVERASSRTTVGAANFAAVSAGSAENPRPHEHNRFCRVQELEASVLVIASQTFDDDKLTGAHHLVSSRKTQHYSSLGGGGANL